MRFNLVTAIPNNLFAFLTQTGFNYKHMKKFKITLILLLALTLITVLISISGGTYAAVGILAIAVFKFLGVSFYFMELRKAHSMWKGAIIAFLVVFMISIIAMV